jgi:hypothetical protein
MGEVSILKASMVLPDRIELSTSPLSTVGSSSPPK